MLLGTGPVNATARQSENTFRTRVESGCNMLYATAMQQRHPQAAKGKPKSDGLVPDLPPLRVQLLDLNPQVSVVMAVYFNMQCEDRLANDLGGPIELMDEVDVRPRMTELVTSRLLVREWLLRKSSIACVEVQNAFLHALGGKFLFRSIDRVLSARVKHGKANRRSLLPTIIYVLQEVIEEATKILNIFLRIKVRPFLAVVNSKPLLTLQFSPVAQSSIRMEAIRVGRYNVGWNVYLSYVRKFVIPVFIKNGMFGEHRDGILDFAASIYLVTDEFRESRGRNSSAREHITI